MLSNSKRSPFLAFFFVVLAGCSDGDATDTSSVSNNGSAGASAGAGTGGAGGAAAGQGGAAGTGGAAAGTGGAAAGQGGSGAGGNGCGPMPIGNPCNACGFAQLPECNGVSWVCPPCGAGGAGAGGAGAGGAGAGAGGEAGCGPKPSTLCEAFCGEPVELICVGDKWMCPVGGEPCAGAGGAGAGGGAGSAGSGGVPDFCGGEAGIPCPAGYFCDFPANDCGGGDTTGKCQPKPDDSCPTTNPPMPPVCGCDKKVYASPCEAAMGGTDVASFSNFCEPPANTFKCGEKFCDLGHYCQIDVSDVASFPTTYSCQPLPEACLIIDALPSCQCIKSAGNIPCADICKDDGKGAVTVTCPGG